MYKSSGYLLTREQISCLLMVTRDDAISSKKWEYRTYTKVDLFDRSSNML